MRWTTAHLIVYMITSTKLLGLVRVNMSVSFILVLELDSMYRHVSLQLRDNFLFKWRIGFYIDFQCFYCSQYIGCRVCMKFLYVACCASKFIFHHLACVQCFMESTIFYGLFPNSIWGYGHFLCSSRVNCACPPQYLWHDSNPHSLVSPTSHWCDYFK